MAKSYFGKFDGINSVMQAQQALDQGRLLKPFVAIYSVGYDESVHYDDLEETVEGEVSNTEYTGVTWEGTADVVTVNTQGTFYWKAEGYPEWIAFSEDGGAPDFDPVTVTMYINQNENESDRTANFSIVFYYDEDRTVVRNVVSMSVQQVGHHIQDGYVSPASGSVGYNYTRTSFGVYADYLYWEVSGKPEWMSLSADAGFGSTTETLYFSNNPWSTRNCTLVFNFYTDNEHTEFKNSVTFDFEQIGENRPLASWSDSSYVQGKFVSSDSGTTNFYIINNPNNYYVRYTDFDGAVSTASPETTALTLSYPKSQQYNPESKVLTVWFCETPYGSSVYDSYLFLTQEGDESLSHIEYHGTSIPASGGTGTLEIYMEGEAVTWMIELNDASYASFPDYPGQTSITGDSSVSAVTFSVGRNFDEWGHSIGFAAYFYDQYGSQIAQGQGLGIYQEQGENHGDAYFDETGDQIYMVSGNWTGDVYATTEPEADNYYAWTDESSSVISTGSTSGSSVIFTVTTPNTSGNYVETKFYCNFYSDSSLTQQVGRKELVLIQEPAQEEVFYECAFVTQSANETLNVASGGGMLEFVNAYLDGSNNIVNDIQYDGDGHFTYTFPSAGTHVIAFTRENDPYLQSWFQNTDMYSFTGHSTSVSWGFWENVFDGSNISEITIDEHCNQFNGDTFSGLPDLIQINMYMSDDSGYGQGLFPSEITDHPGTLHIPSGTTSNYQNLIAALGANWTVVDDL